MYKIHHPFYFNRFHFCKSLTQYWSISFKNLDKFHQPTPTIRHCRVILLMLLIHFVCTYNRFQSNVFSRQENLVTSAFFFLFIPNLTLKSRYSNLCYTCWALIIGYHWWKNVCSLIRAIRFFGNWPILTNIQGNFYLMLVLAL